MLVDAGAEYSELRHAPAGAVEAAPPAVTSTPLRERPRTGAPRWMRRYRAALLLLDCLIAAATGAVMIPVRPVLSATAATYVGFSLALPLMWALVLAVSNAYSPKHLGNGSEEFRRVTRAGVILLAAVSVVSYAAKLDIARSFVLFAIPAMTLVTLVGRYSARKQL